MSLIKWSPFLEPFEDMDKMFSDFMSKAGGEAFMPAMDISQTKDAVIVETQIKDFDPEKVEISIENDVLTVKGKTEEKKEVEEKNYLRKEIKSGKFFRQVALPVPVLGDKTEAVFDGDILKITVPKAPEAREKRVKVKVIKPTKK